MKPTRFSLATGVILFSLLLVTATAFGATRYVNLNNPAPAPPYTDWATAATNIQDAIDAATVGDEIVVTNGVYATGGRLAGGDPTTNRVVVTKPLTVRSVNGPDGTVIEGYKTPGAEAGVGLASVRCVYLASGASLVGFTLTNGAAGMGGGILCESTASSVSNSVMSGNSAGYADGGGAHGGSLYRCTITGNVALGDGGGADRGVLINCLITKNTANRGGGVDDSTLHGCIVADNKATEAGGGTLQSTLYNCTVTGNSAHRNAGVASKRFNGEAAYNCIIYGNKAALAPNYGEDDYSKVLLHHCCTTPLPSFGEGNIDSDPLLLSANRIAGASPCIGAGAVAYATGVDIDGYPWRNPPSMGADEVAAGAATGPVSVILEAEFTNVAPAYVSVFKVAMEGLVTSNYWTLGDGTVWANRQEVEHAWAGPGNYPVTVTAFNDSHPAGVSATVQVHVVSAPIHYVNLVNATPSFPFTSWPTAATNIQDAIAASTVAGRRVVVTNGVYDTGGTVVFGSMSNRVALTQGVLVESVNGPSVTVIQGAGDVGSGFGDTAIRCAYVGNGSKLEGFTLTGGSTRAAGDRSREQGGGGAWCEKRGVLADCMVRNNRAAVDGGGVHGGTLLDCWISDNFAVDDGGGADSATLSNCILRSNSSLGGGGATDECTLQGCVLTGNSASTGGGADDCTLRDCTVAGNRAGNSGGGGGVSGCIADRCQVSDNVADRGGGAFRGILRNSILEGNRADRWGGGSSFSTLNNCTVVGNRVSGASDFDSGGGVYSGTVDNCIVYYNDAQNGPNYDAAVFGFTMNHTCTEPLPPFGTGHIAVAPVFAENLRLQSNSPCINAGRNASSPLGPDLDGLARIAGGTADMGAYEFQTPASTLSYAWLLQHGLPLDGSADTTDPDGDRFDNNHEWRAGTDPNNALSALRLRRPVVSDLGMVTWESVPGRTYSLERSEALGGFQSFVPVATGVPAAPNGNLTTYFDFGADILAASRFYRVRVE